MNTQTDLTGRTADAQSGQVRPLYSEYRLAVSPQEAADLLGVSRDFFDEHIRPELRVVRRGRRILIPLRELERWLDENASSVLKDLWHS